MMASDFDRILDECIDRLGRGESLEACLAAYPEHAKPLEPLLRAMVQTEAACSFTVSVDAKRETRKRLYAALDRRRQPSFWRRRMALATLAGVLVAVVAGYLALSTMPFRAEPPSITIPGPAAEGNFAFLVSDEVNAIADFSHLNVTVSKVGLLQGGSSARWVEFVPEVREFDLTLLPGEKTQELWRGSVPEGEYTKVFIYVTTVRGVLKATGGVAEVKLPSNKLQISKPFQVSAGAVTSFTYDLTVIKTGNARGGGRYLIKPQVGESGGSQKPDQGQGKPGRQP
ncbi:MAG: DUF4382 domain-containing protein [Dehalococcoidia bacterium]|nr:DUF4382 domain-containing protein [Dehalococcoidia bacterium]